MASRSSARFIGLARHALSQSGMSQRTLEKASGVHLVTINRILMGRQEPTLEVVEKIAKALRIDPAKIFEK